MFRALSTRRSGRRYEQLVGDEAAHGLLDGQLKRATSLPARLFGSSSRRLPPPQELKLPEIPPAKPSKKANKSQSHPLFSLFDTRRRKKTTARPEFARYVQYVKEGGMWDLHANAPAIYYK